MAAQVDNATGRLTKTFITKEPVGAGRGGEAATQDVCRILMAVKLMGDVRTTGEAPCLGPASNHKTLVP